MPTSPHPTATARTLRIWLLTNLGGTAWLVLDFCRESPSDIMVPLIIGLMAALLSLLAVPLAIPFFALTQLYCSGWQCRLSALAVVVAGFVASNYLIINTLPVGPVSSLLTISQPYLVATVLAVMWIYRPEYSLKLAWMQAIQQFRSTRRTPIKGAIKLSGLAH
jgi:hypothetical protein